MYCMKCGKQIPDGSEFCQFCGTKQNATNTEQPKNQDDSYLETIGVVADEFQKAGKGKRIMIIVCAIISICIAWKMLTFIGGNSGSTQQAAIPQKQTEEVAPDSSSASSAEVDPFNQAEVAKQYTNLTSADINADNFNTIYANNISMTNKAWVTGRWITDDNNGFLYIDYDQSTQLYMVNFVYSSEDGRDEDQFYISEYPSALAEFPSDFSGDDIGEMKIAMMALDESKNTIVIHVQALTNLSVPIPEYLVLTPDESFSG